MTENTQNILKIFEDISKVPRKSKHEEKIIAWLLNWAKDMSLDAKKDPAGNVLILVPPSKGYENSPPVVLQGHMDMVCEKEQGSNHDFLNDPIELLYDGDWVRANRTTLGADNGIAMAIMLYAAASKSNHPPLELLFTIDEETGLTGATRLEKNFLKGRILLNIDSEDEGILTIGCAGGMSSEISMPLSFFSPSEKLFSYELKVGGLIGGHSGIDINKGRANAIKLLCRVLSKLRLNNELYLGSIGGGTAHNAISRDAEAVIFLKDNKAFEKISAEIKNIESIFISEFRPKDPDITISLRQKSGSSSDKVLTDESFEKVVRLIVSLPHGVFTMSGDIPGLVETSNNLATVCIEKDFLKILSSQRSSSISRLYELTEKIESICSLAGGNVQNGDGYPPWEPDWNSKLLCKCKEIYLKRFGKEPVVEIIHAGLECGIIGSKYDGMDMISLGPTIKNPHSPDERMKISDIDKIWDFLNDLLGSFCR
jgi:dipeptidase D